MSPIFTRMMPLGRDDLAVMLGVWWDTGAKAGVVTVRRRLHLGQPEGEVAAGWVLTGHITRFADLGRIPIVVELWPVHERFTRMTMTPQRRVVVSWGYFRLGHNLIDSFWAQLLGSDMHPAVGSRRSGDPL